MIRIFTLGPAKHEEVAIYVVNLRIPNVCRIARAACAAEQFVTSVGGKIPFNSSIIILYKDETKRGNIKMSFFGNLFKGEAKKIISGVVDNIMDSAQSNSPFNKSSVELTGEAGLRDRVENAAKTQFLEYEFRVNIPAAEMGAEYGAKDYSYGFYKDGIPKAFIMVTNRSHYARKEMRLAEEAAKRQGIPCMKFFEHLPNEQGYVTERIRKNILR